MVGCGVGESDETTCGCSESSPFDQSGLVHVFYPRSFALPRRQTFVGLTFPPRNRLEISIHAMEQTTALYSLLSCIVLLISSVSLQSKPGSGPPRDEYTFILVL